MDKAKIDEMEDAAAGFATQLGIPYFDTRPHIDIRPLIGKLTLVGMQAYGIVPLALEGNKLTIGTSEETDRAQLESLRHRLTGYQVEFVFISQFGWNRLFNRYSVAGNQDILESGDFSNIENQLENLEPKFMFEPLAQLAYQIGASDIHVEPTEHEARIRFRVDGMLHPITTIPKDRFDLFASDLEMRAGLKWGGDTPQGGRISMPVINDDGDQVELNMRLETIPSLHGEDVVIRLFNLSIKYLTLDNLQLSEEHKATLLRSVAHPRGMVMTVGPTGSGKTSTLYSIMNYLNNPESKIVTLEDPIEYELAGVSQVPVRGDDQQLFMEKLRAVLREDPNVIMIGEIRDADTAKTALQAALTGHLVLSSFHATNASAAVSRLMDMIGENPLLASSIKLIMAQRLVRRLCDNCKTFRPPTKDELLQIKATLADLSADLYPPLADLQLADPVGCNICHHFGYQGRINIIEQLEVTSKMETLIAKGTAATTEAIEQAAIKDGMITILQDGIIKAMKGLVQLEEVF
ncbi:MAG TPA: GspE/PulE family protein, partial [Candidatus Saccharimonadia bacterium]|nr:GspE/PulE family protein [Candidatus Saccharimonadia bacterium]